MIARRRCSSRRSACAVSSAVLVRGERVALGASVDELIAAFDVHIGTPDEVEESLRADSTLDRVTDVVVQVHSVDPPHPFILRSIELFTREVAPALGWAKTSVQRQNRLSTVP